MQDFFFVMDKEYFTNAFDTTVPIAWNGLNCPVEQSFLESNSSAHRFSHFELPLSSGLPNDVFALRELIGEHGGIAPRSSTAMEAAPYDSYHGTPFNSALELQLPIHDQINRGTVGNSLPLPAVSADPGFAERAAKFSCFGSRSFNGRTSPVGLNNAELQHRFGNLKLPRVSSSPVLKQAGSPLENKNLSQFLMEMRPNDEMLLHSDKSSVSEQIPIGERKSKTLNEPNSRKRKSASRGKPKEDDGSGLAKGTTDDEDGNIKRSKSTEGDKNEYAGSKTEEEPKGGSIEKPPEAPKDYIHVRARRGQATDSHSLAERVRREKISERMKLLQDLVPGCNKVTGKALMLDEIINYVQSLQCQVEFLSMKLASVNPELDVNMGNLLTKDMFQQNGTVQQLYHLDSSAGALNNHQSQQNVQHLHHTDVSTGPLSQFTADPAPTHTPLGRSFGIQLPSLDGFSELLPQFLALGEDDLHSIVSMGIGQNPVSFTVPNQTSDMKAER